MLNFKQGFIKLMKAASTNLSDVKDFGLANISIEEDGKVGVFGGEVGHVLATLTVTNSFDETIEDALHTWSPITTAEAFKIFKANYETLIEDADVVKAIKAALLDDSVTGADAVEAALAKVHNTSETNSDIAIYLSNNAVVITHNADADAALVDAFEGHFNQVLYKALEPGDYVPADKFYCTNAKADGLVGPDDAKRLIAMTLEEGNELKNYFDLGEHTDYELKDTATVGTITPICKLDIVNLSVGIIKPTIPYYLGQLTFDTEVVDTLATEE